MHLLIDYVVSYNFHIVRLLSDPLHDKTAAMYKLYTLQHI